MFERILDIRSARTKSLAALAKRVGGNPATFYRGADFSNTDLRGQDLSGYDLTGARWAGALVDLRTKIDFPFVADARNAAIEKLKARVEGRSDPRALWELILLYSVVPDQFAMTAALRDLVEDYQYAPINLAALSGKLVGDHDQTPLVERFIVQHHLRDDFDKLYADLLVDPHWKGTASRSAVRQMFQGQRGRAPTSVARAVATAAEHDATLAILLERWANERGTQDRAASVISRALVSMPASSEWIDVWALRWLKRNPRGGLPNRALAVVPTILARSKNWFKNSSAGSLGGALISALEETSELATEDVPRPMLMDLARAVRALKTVIGGLPRPNKDEAEIQDRLDRIHFLCRSALSNLPRKQKGERSEFANYIVGDVISYIVDDWPD